MEPTPQQNPPQTTGKPVILEPPGKWWRVDLAEIWMFRELFLSLVRRDFQVRYKQTILGPIWTLIRPLVTTVVFTVIFGKLGNISTDGLPEPLFYLTGITIWRYFEQASSIASHSLLANQTLLTKIYVPRLILPTSGVIVSLIDFSLSFGLLLILMLFYGVSLSWTIFWCPLLILLAILNALGFGLFMSALNVRFRDVRHFLPFLMQLWMFATIIVPYSRIEQTLGAWKWVYGLNPLGMIVEAFRWAVLQSAMEGHSPFPVELLPPGLAMTFVLFFAGFFVFKKMEHEFADII